MPETPPPAGEALAAGQVLPLAPSRRTPSRRTPPRRPLPDAVAVRRIPVPESAPPYDDELPADGKPAAGRAPSSGRRQPARLAEPAAPEPPRRGQAAVWPSRFAQVLAETLAGSRPPRQITPWTTEQARRQLRQLGPMLSAGQQPRVRRVLTSCPAADVVELTAVVAFGPRVRALAVRLERDVRDRRPGHDGPRPGGPGREPDGARWRCTAVESA
jgi:Family of unknown function (DUF6459)